VIRFAIDIALRARSAHRWLLSCQAPRPLAVAFCVALGAAAIVRPDTASAAPVVQSQSQSQDAAQNTRSVDASNAAPVAHVNLAVYEGDDPPMDLLQAFDAVVLDPARTFDPSSQPLEHTVYLARLDGVDPHASSFIADHIAPLWQRGFRGFVVDAKGGEGAIDAIHAAYPDAKIVVAGPDALDIARAHRNHLYAVLTQGLFTSMPGNDADSPPAASAGVDAVRAFVRDTRVPVVTIEYCEKTDRACARKAAHDALAAGLDVYATDPSQSVVGIGRIEVMPRKVLVVQDREASMPVDLTPGVRLLATPLNYLGYDVQYVDAASPLPANVTPDRYAGVVAWIQRGDVADQTAWRRWVRRVVAAQVPIAFIGQFGFAADSDELPGLRRVSGTLARPISIVEHDPMVGFETMPPPDMRDLPRVRVDGAGRSLLGIDAGGTRVDAVGVMPWGGFALNQYSELSLDAIEQERWVIQPIDFLKTALRLPALPGPSVTTENGRRLLMSHVDGDGFASHVEFPGPDYAGQALYDRIWTKYPIPVTLSVIEGEVGPQGLYPKLSPRLEQIARKMFALPYVEMGTHTYSHPFIWEEVDTKSGARTDRGGTDAAFSLNIPGYKFNLDREISGSIHYIDSRLAPPGKQVTILQWSGDCMPPAVAVRRAYESGVYNINGGDTVITKTQNSWTAIAPIGIDKGPGAYQVFAPNQDENVYTNDWQGPFYGFEQVLQTFAMTDAPLRFKPIDLYYHMYSGTKIASLTALDHILTAVLAQPVLPVRITDYVRKVLDWHTFAVAREGDAWLVRGNGAVRELHWTGSEVPRLSDASGVTGYARGPDGIYVHFDDGTARFALESPSQTRNTAPYIAQANGFVRDFQRGAHSLRFSFGGYYKPFVTIANAGQCRASSAGRTLDGRREGGALTIALPAVPGQQVAYQPIQIDCGE